jgi:hypothetical protein
MCNSMRLGQWRCVIDGRDGAASYAVTCHDDLGALT